MARNLHEECSGRLDDPSMYRHNFFHCSLDLERYDRKRCDILLHTVWNRHDESSCGSLVVRGSLRKAENIKREVIVEEE